MKSTFFSFLLVPTLYPTCNFLDYQIKQLESDRLSYQRIINDSLVINLREKNTYDHNLGQQISQCYEKMAEEQFQDCKFEKIKANIETYKYDDLVNERHWLGSNYIYTNWSIDTQKYKNLIMPARVKYYSQLWSWMGRCFNQTELQNVTHKSIRELYETIRDSQSQFDLRQLKYMPLKKGISLSKDYVNGVFSGSKDGNFQRIEIQFSGTNVYSVFGTGDYSDKTNLKISEAL